MAGAGVGWQLAGAGQLQALDDCCLAGAVGADDEGEGLEEGDDVLVVGVEAPDPLDEHLVHRTHLAPQAPGAAASAASAPPPVGAGAITRNLDCGCYSGIHLLVRLRHGWLMEAD